MATLIKTDGTRKEIFPHEGAKFTLKELYAFVGSPIDIQRRPDNKLFLVVNDNGKLSELPVNEEASKIWRAWYPIEKYPLNNDGTIVGDVVIGTRKEIG